MKNNNRLEIEETYLKEEKNKNKRKISQKLRNSEDTVFKLKRKYTNRKIKNQPRISQRNRINF